MNSLYQDLKDVFKKHWRDRNRKSWVYCPACKHDLNGDNSSFQFQRMTEWNSEPATFWFFKCSNCACESQFLLEMLPILYARQHYGKKLVREVL